MRRRTMLGAGLGLWLAAAMLPMAAAPAQTGPAVPERPVLRINVSSPIGTLDPQRTNQMNEAQILQDLYEGLFELDPQGRVIPALAERMETSPDGKVLTFHLRGDGRWSDGTPVVAGDFVRGWRRLADPATAAAYAFYMWPLENGRAVTEGKAPAESLGVTAPDERTLVVRLAEPAAYFPAMLAQATLYPLHPKALEGGGFSTPGAVPTNGPYVLTGVVPNETVTLAKNPLWRASDTVRIPRVVYSMIQDRNTELKLFRTGELDVTWGFPVTQVGWVRENLARNLKEVPSYSVGYVSMNLRNEPWKSAPALRRAMDMALDKQTIAETILFGQRPAYAFTPTGGVAGYEPPRPDWADLPKAEREARAKALLAEAGYGPGGKPLPKVELIFANDENQRRVAVAVAAMWKQVLGIDTSLNNMEGRIVSARSVSGDFKDTLYYGWYGDYADPTTFLEILRSGVAQNVPGYSNPEFDRLLSAANAVQDPAERLRLMAEAEAVMVSEAPLIPISNGVRRRLVADRVKGFQPRILDLYPVKELWIEE